MLLFAKAILPRHCFEATTPGSLHMHPWFHPIGTAVADMVQAAHLAERAAQESPYRDITWHSASVLLQCLQHSNF